MMILLNPFEPKEGLEPSIIINDRPLLSWGYDVVSWEDKGKAK